MKKRKQPKQTNQPTNQQPSNPLIPILMSIGPKPAGILVIIILLMFGKTIAVSMIMFSVGWATGKVFKIIDRRKTS